MSKRALSLFNIVILSVLVAACSAPSSNSGGGSSSKPEAEYCSPTSPVPSGSSYVTISGTAQYRKRKILVNGTLSSSANLDLKSIRRAEVIVTNSAGARVFCTETSNTGTFSVVLPINSGTYTVSVNSRGSNSYVNASILSDPTNNIYYALAGTVASSSDSSIGLIAEVSGELLGGAFNIFDVIVRANDFLRERTSGCDTSFSGCAPFTVAPKVYAYWAKGLNPGTYVGTSSSLSFYLTGKSQLYILGGSNGNVNSADTDHFDDAVIAHEYGHFIDDRYVKSDSPGGSHNGNSVIDPRLAWGEGFADFFGSAVSGYGASDGNPVYADTSGNGDGTATSLIFYNIETHSAGYDDPPDANSGEGNFREFAIARALWDIADGSTTNASLPNTDTNDSGSSASTLVNQDNVFHQYWHVFTGSFKSSSRLFRNFGLFMQLLTPNPTNMTNYLATNLQKQKNDQSDYSGYLYVCGAGDTFNITPATSTGAIDTIEETSSNQWASNDFFRFAYSGGAATLTIEPTSATAVDLDIYVYRDGYKFGDSSTMVAIGNTTSSSDSASMNTSAGTYMVNINAAASTNCGSAGCAPKGAGVSQSYKLKLNGNYLCVDLAQ